MGQVWLAEQTSPVRRQVAIKFVRPGIFSNSLLAAFSMGAAIACHDGPSRNSQGL